MKKETALAKEFREKPIKKWIITDSDGTVFPFVKFEEKEKALPPKEFLEQMKQHSLNNPETGIMVLSGRMSGELNEFYKEAMTPDQEGRVPKIVLASENGAFMQFKPIKAKAENLADHADVVQVSEPMSDELKAAVEKIMKDAAGEHYTSDNKNTSEDKWVRSELKTYGVTAHLVPPANEADMAEFQAIKEQIATGFQQLGEERGLLVHLDAAAALTIELVSKELTMQNVATANPELMQLFADNGLTTEKPTQMSYSGDDVGDMAAINVLNGLFASGELTGYTSRPSNYTPFDPEGRVPNDPKEPRVQDAFYIVGSESILPQEQHRSYFVSTEAFDQLSNLRQALSDRELLSSQSGDDQTPPVVLLNSGDILIQEAERYSLEALRNLSDWDHGKVVLMVSESSRESMAIRDLPGENPNIIVATPEGKFYTQGQAPQSEAEAGLLVLSKQYSDFTNDVRKAQMGNEVISANPQRSRDIEVLRNIQTVLVEQGFISDVEKELAKEAARQYIQEATNGDVLGIVPPAVTQKTNPSPQILGLQALAATPIATISSNASERHNKRLEKARNRVEKKLGQRI